MHNYAWGDREAIADLQGREPTGAPEAELWFGAHPSAPALTSEGPLDEVYARESAAPLPFMVKLLAAAKPLSLQAHPSRSQARAGFARENAAGIARDAAHRNYKDANHKPEILIALTPFRAMAGFRPLAGTLELVRAFDLPELADIEHSLADASLTPRDRLSRTLERAMGSSAAAAVGRRAAELKGRPGVVGEVAANLEEIAREYPGDSGVVAAMLLNHVCLEPGEAIFLPAGNLHAYLRGLGVEVMASSDNVLRGGLTQKHVDSRELFSILRFDTLEDPTVAPERGRYAVDVDDFAVAVVPSGESVTGPAIVLNVSGSLAVEDVELGPGEAAWVSSRDGAVVLDGKNSCAFVAAIPRD
ncbi:mannose-6-phosphate isomerase, class I [Corynebacterium liangguodongii]|uniref:mannose-6-phosphate isomerase n=2 Tax=Corynebacterium liangguodongii TaxID=2079535 RepID=A0A2S0WGS7_9CORY|nr:mannose-6-phosphate isomerase, class I [Corynebacterium liangguodongii]PWB99407.1 mannose-6-phosphate isomerase, class I [Corynebacterium liangguodongii]